MKSSMMTKEVAPTAAPTSSWYSLNNNLSSSMRTWLTSFLASTALRTASLTWIGNVSMVQAKKLVIDIAKKVKAIPKKQGILARDKYEAGVFVSTDQFVSWSASIWNWKGTTWSALPLWHYLQWHSHWHNLDWKSGFTWCKWNCDCDGQGSFLAMASWSSGCSSLTLP